MRFLAIFVILCLPLGVSAETRAAFIVGNSNYENAPTLSNPTRDAKLIANTLRQLKFSVTQHENLSRDRFADALSDFVRKNRDTDVTFFYFAGHGMQFDGKNYLVGTDAELRSELDIDSETIELSKVVDLLERNSKATLVFVDACRDNPLASDFYRRNFSETRAMNTRGLARIGSRIDGSMLVFAAAPGQVAYDGSGRNSPFAEALAKHLPTENTEVLSLTKRIIGDVRKATGGRQSPIVTNDLTREIFLREVALRPSVAGPGETEREEKVFSAARSNGTLHAWSRYFSMFPQGSKNVEALQEEHDVLMLELAHLAADWGKVELDIAITPALATAFEDRIGFDREDRLAVQALLARLDYYDGPLDGVLGNGSRSALREFQRSLNLPETGIITRETAESLGVGLAARYESPKASSVRQRSMLPSRAALLEMDERLQGFLRRAAGTRAIYGFRGDSLYIATTSSSIGMMHARLNERERSKMFLASIGSADENNFVYEMVRHDQNFWKYDDEYNPTYYGPTIGLMQDKDGREPRGGWAWESGEKESYRNWGRGQPDDFRNREDYVHMWIQGRKYATSPDLPNGPTWNDQGGLYGPFVFELVN